MGDSGIVKPFSEPKLLDITIEPSSWHRYEIQYHPGNDGLLTPGSDSAEWYVDEALVHKVNWVATVEPPKAPVIKPARFKIVMGIFTLLDDLPDGRGEVIHGLDSEYKQTIFGQGATVKWRNFKIATGAD